MKLLITFPEFSLSKGIYVDHGESFIRHERYYFRDAEMAIFKIEDRLYKVHRHFFIRESEVLASMFSCPSGPHDDQEGNCDTKPIYLPEVTSAEFEALLDFFYYGMFESKSPAKSAHTTSNCEREHVEGNKKMLDLLSISLRYAFDNIIKEILVSIDVRRDGSVDPVTKVILALKHDVLRHWLLPAFQELLERPKSLTREEIEKLGPTKASIISSKREDGMRGGREDFFIAGTPGDIMDEAAIPMEFFIDN